MDWIALKNNGISAAKKYRYVLLVVLAGIVLMALPSGEGVADPEPEIQTETVVHTDLQAALKEILSQISGAGRVEVLLTQASGEETIYQTDGTQSDTDLRRQTVLVSGADREEEGLVRQINPPVYQGAIIVCQGADSAAVRLSIVEAVSNATGISTDRISVLKMK